MFINVCYRSSIPNETSQSNPTMVKTVRENKKDTQNVFHYDTLTLIQQEINFPTFVN